MNDHPTPEHELASAYLDDQVTAAERAHVEATPELVTMVASLRRIATSIADVPATTETAREAAIAAALSEFDRLADSNVVSLDSRRWSRRVLATAAAVVLLGVVGITVLRSGDDSKSESATRANEPKLETNTAEDAIGAAVPASESGDEVPVALAAPIEINDPQELLALVVPTPPSPTTIAAVDQTTADTTADGGGFGGADDSQRVESFNVEALACMTDNQVFLADIYYKGALAIAVRDTVTGVTEAIDSDCTVLASVAP